MTKSELFVKAMADLTTAFNAAHAVVEDIIKSGDNANIIDEVGDTDSKITVLEPAMIMVEAKRLMDHIGDLALISTIQHVDPKHVFLDENGKIWYDVVKGNPNTVNAVKSIRSAFYNVPNARFGIKEAKRIAELIEEGKI